MDKGAWRAAVHGVTKSQTRLKQPGMYKSLTLPTYRSQTEGSFPDQGGLLQKSTVINTSPCAFLVAQGLRTRLLMQGTRV